IVARLSARVDGALTRALTGLGVGSGVVLAGVGGPAITVYAVLSRWPVRGFSATMQPLWVLMSLGGFVPQLSFSGNEVPVFPWWVWLGSLAAILTGMAIASAVRPWISDPAARRIVILLAFLGASISLVMGIGEDLGA